jgi:LysR family transcriptional regulator, regulator for bpeEF and oprC
VEQVKMMEVFKAVADLGSFSRAAEYMSLGRPQVSRVIQELEGSVGVRLFHRTTRNVRLTFEGEQFYERIDLLLADIEEVNSMFNKGCGDISGRLRVDIPTALAQESFLANLKQFSDSYPNIELSLGITDRTVDLVAEGVDCVLRLGSLPSSNLIAKPIGRVRMVTCASPQYLEQHGEPKTLDELTSHVGVNFLSGQNNRLMPWSFYENGEERKLNCRNGVIVNESNSYVECGVVGFGIIQAPGITLHKYLHSGRLVEVLKNYQPESKQLSILYAERKFQSLKTRAFIEWVSQSFPKLYSEWINVK